MFEAVAIGVSAGGMQALKTLFGGLPSSFPLAIAVVQHLEARSDTYLCDYLNELSGIEVKEAEDKEPMRAGVAYLAPAGYHLLIEPGRSFSLSVDEKVNFCRPSIDLLFESAADALGSHLIGVVLTGANGDGALGLKRIKERGGFTVVQNPETAEVPFMPRAAIAATAVDEVTDLDLIAPILIKLGERTAHGSGIT